MAVTLQTGTILGRYQLLSQLGRGGMASVWVARERIAPDQPERLLAVKAMRPDLGNLSDFRSMFLGEGQIIRSIEHEHVVRVYEVGEDRGILYMAMEWVEGDSLRTLIRVANQRRPIPTEDAVRIIADVASGLHAAHELRGWDGELRNLVHCDVSPHNILIGVNGVTKLVDFGVANAAVLAHLDQPDHVKGKFGYMSPEQARAAPLDRRADVFALGVVLFELTTGQRLFRGRDAAHTTKLLLHGQIPTPTMLDPAYPPALERIVMRALERDLDARYASADELRAALERYLVDQRILVARAGIGKLVLRVLGDRIEQRRAEVEAARREVAAKGGGPRIGRWGARRRSLVFSVGAVFGAAVGAAGVAWGVKATPAVAGGTALAAVPSGMVAPAGSGASAGSAHAAPSFAPSRGDATQLGEVGRSAPRAQDEDEDDPPTLEQQAEAERESPPEEEEEVERETE